MDEIELFKILDEENCPCGSEIPYSKCCKNRKDENINIVELLENEGRMNHEIIKQLKSSKIRICMHPNKQECSSDIKCAHSLQNNGVLSLIAENGHVIEIKPGVNKNGIKLDIKPGSKNIATTFTGFCGYHDTEVFKPIETIPYDKISNRQNFLFAYRIYAYEYYKKLVAIKSFQKLVRKLPTRLHDETFVSLYRGYQLSIKDFDSYKEIMNTCLINSDFNEISTYVIEFDYKIAFATCFAYTPLFDFKGHKLGLDTLSNLNEDRLKINFVTVIPQKSKSYIIYSWLKEDDDYFELYINQLKDLNTNEVKKVFNNLLPEYSENIVFAPKLWNRFSEYQQDQLTNKLISNIPSPNIQMHVPNELNTKLNITNRAAYNLFLKFD